MQSPQTQLERRAVPTARVVRDLLVFYVKLIAAGLIDVVLAPVAVVAVIAGIATGRPDRWLYRVLGWGRSYERWVNLFGAVDRHAPAAGLDEHLERIESSVTGAVRRGR